MFYNDLSTKSLKNNIIELTFNLAVKEIIIVSYPMYTGKLMFSG